MIKNIKNGTLSLDNTKMHYVSFGKGKKALVVLPGLSDGLATVKGKARILYLPYRKYLKDYTVYMFSRKNEMAEDYTIRQMAEDQARAMQKLGIRRACILGVSQGGMIAQYLAIDHPEMTNKLILAMTAPCANNTIQKAVKGWIKMAEGDDHKALMTDTAEKMYSDTYLNKYRRFLPLLAKFTKPADYDRFLKNANAILNFDARKELSGIICPTLVLAGEDDHTVGNRAAYELRRKISNCRLYIYKGLGHGVFEEEARDFYDRVFHFCSREDTLC